MKPLLRLDNTSGLSVVALATALAITLGILVAGCGSDRGLSRDDREAGSAELFPSPAEAFRVEIPPLRRQTLGITFASVERRHVEGTLRIPGAFESTPSARNEYRIALSGHVEVLVERYEEVEEGEPLFRYRSPEWIDLRRSISVAEGAIEAARAEVELAGARVRETEQRIEITTDRLARKSNAGFEDADLAAAIAMLEASLPPLRAERERVSVELGNREREFEDMLAHAAAITGVAAISLAEPSNVHPARERTYRTLDWIDVRAEAPGVVVAIGAPRTGFVEASRLVLETVDPTLVEFRGRLLQTDAARLEGARARVRPRGSFSEQLPSEPATAFAGVEANPIARTLDVLARPETVRAWMRPGIAAELEIVTESSGGPTLAIPRAALVRDGVDLVFFRRDPGDKDRALRIEADTGAHDGTWIAIHSGLGPNDEVVLAGAYELVLALGGESAQPKGGHMHADGTFHEDH